ncbi:tryptophan--tRNA ligase [archaeon]|jgi:tryptophanyl-tRNA synthetase|nr:tryptophan--tRNA ligase [archaeon]
MTKNQTVNPYEVEGKVDYAKLIKEFGIRELTPEALDYMKEMTGDLHQFLRRGIFFAYRDLKKILDDHKKGNKFFLYTGCGPSGPIHLGHYTIWEFTKWLQEKFGVELWFQFTDDEKYLYKNKTWEEIQEWTYQNMLDVIAIGFDPKKTHFLIDTQHAGIMYPEAVKVAKKITFNSIKSAFGFNDSNNIGSIFYTAMQTVPIFLPNVLSGKNENCLIPLAIDQDVHFRLSRDVVEKLGHKKPAIIHGKFLTPLTGPEGKMSSTTSDTAILMTDTPEEVKRKINKYAFSGGKDTVEEHRKHGGNVEIDVSCQWLKYFIESDAELNEIYKKYEKGELLSGEVKNILIHEINKVLAKHQKRRKEAPKLLDEFIYKVK